MIKITGEFLVALVAFVWPLVVTMSVDVNCQILRQRKRLATFLACILCTYIIDN